MADYEQDHELSCPKCNHSPLCFRDCAELMCDDGLMDDCDDDPINFMPGESTHLCPECRGTGIEWWCPNCGENLSGKISSLEQDDNLQDE